MLLLLVACGRTAQQPATGDGGGSSAAGGATAQSCLYPLTLPQAPTNPNPGERAFQLSTPFPVQLTGDSQNLASLAATLDVNGDLVSDLFFVNDAGAQSRFRLLLSGAPPNIFDYTETTCSALEQLPAGRRLFLRDLDDDAVPDFIVATNLGVKAFLNHPHGLEPVLDSVVASSPVAIINLDTADLDGDGRTDLVLSYDHDKAANDIWFASGIVMFQQNQDGTFAETIRSYTGYATDDQTGQIYTGYFAVGPFGPAKQTTVVATAIGDSEDFAELPFLVGQGIVAPEVVDSINQLANVRDSDGSEYLGAIGFNNFYLLDASVTPARVAFQGSLAYAGNFSAPHYGSQDLPRFFFYDFDHDGDDDFFESKDGPARPDQPELALHINLGGQLFAEPQRFPIHLNNTTDAPFLLVGPGSGLVTSPDAIEPKSAAYTLYPAANAAP